MSTSTQILALAVMMMATAAIAAPTVRGNYAPKDECAKVSGAAAFRTALASAVRQRNVPALLALTDARVKLDYGGGEGHAELRERLSSAEGEALWRALDNLLPLGCAVDQDDLVLPWFFAQDLEGDDPFNLLLVTGERVPLLPKADGEAKPLRLLSWELVEPREGYGESAEYQPVRIAGGGAAGFVQASKLRSPLDYRLIVARSTGAWKIEAFIAGD